MSTEDDRPKDEPEAPAEPRKPKLPHKFVFSPNTPVDVMAKMLIDQWHEDRKKEAEGNE